jgi:hypothetical protein
VADLGPLYGCSTRCRVAAPPLQDGLMASRSLAYYPGWPMATRSILTHQPNVSCDVCGRTLLKGERPDVFLAAGDSRTVCELCVPRAAAGGWTRASEALASASVRTPRQRRSRTLLGRLRQRNGADPEGPLRPGAEAEALQREGPKRAAPQPAVLRAEPSEDWQPHGGEAGGTGRAEAGPAGQSGAPVTAELELAYRDAPAPAAEAHLPAEAEAVEIFNASECASRVAGIARALGEPSVSVLASEEHEDRVRIVVAWELCWYRYEVDLRERPATIALVADGTELDQLSPADRLGNAAADERGELSLLH